MATAIVHYKNGTQATLTTDVEPELPFHGGLKVQTSEGMIDDAGYAGLVRAAMAQAPERFAEWNAQQERASQAIRRQRE